MRQCWRGRVSGCQAGDTCASRRSKSTCSMLCYACAHAGVTHLPPPPFPPACPSPQLWCSAATRWPTASLPSPATPLLVRISAAQQHSPAVAQRHKVTSDGGWTGVQLAVLLALQLLLRYKANYPLLLPYPSQTAGYLEEEAVKTYTRCLQASGRAWGGSLCRSGWQPVVVHCERGAQVDRRLAMRSTPPCPAHRTWTPASCRSGPTCRAPTLARTIGSWAPMPPCATCCWPSAPMRPATCERGGEGLVEEPCMAGHVSAGGLHVRMRRRMMGESVC